MTGPETIEPLQLPENFNPATLMLARTTEYGTFHESRQAARLAAQLVANGTAQDIELAGRILAAVLQCQERDERDPHYGNFYWMREDEVVEDLNAVEFVLESLIPMMLQYGDRLSNSIQGQVLEAIRLGLGEIRRLDVLVTYTNITALDILNTCLGGELLKDPAIAGRGYEKLANWIAFTNRSGHPLEYNSPTYTAVTLRALKRLADLVQDRDTQIRARAMAARLALSVTLHIHPGTGRWAGPHSRAYQPTVVCETPPELELVRAWLADGVVPAWVEDALNQRPATMEVTETAERSRQLSFTTYQTAAFALGIASQGYHVQANVCLLHYHRDKATRPGVFYTRYILDDKWFGDSYHATDRTKTRNLPDEGEFFGVQNGNRALCLYGPTSLREGSSAKAALIWSGRDQIDEIWIDGEPATALPASISPEQMVVVGSGSVYMAVRPLAVTPLGRETPIQLIERDGDLVLELYNYQGVYKRFWELRWPGAFFQGRPVCSFYLEVAERERYSDGRAFGREVAVGAFRQELAPPFTYPAEGQRRYTVSYERDGRELGLEVDLMEWQLLRRWTEAGELEWPMLESPVAREADAGRVEVGRASLTCDAGPIWLYANPESGRYVAGYLGLEPASLNLTTPQKTVKVTGMGIGTVVMDKGEVTIEAVGDPQIAGEKR